MKISLNKTQQDHADHNRKMVSNYPIEVSPLSEEEGGGFQALFPPLAHSFVGYGATQQEAILELQAIVPSFLELMAETEQTLPEVAPERGWDQFSGKFNVRVAKMLHAQLVELAEDQGVSLNSLVQTILTSGATALSAGKIFGALEPLSVKTKSPYQWSEESVPIIKFWSVDSHITQGRVNDEWLVAHEG